MLGVSRPIYVNVDSPNLGFPYTFPYTFWGVPVKKITLYVHTEYIPSPHPVHT